MLLINLYLFIIIINYTMLYMFRSFLYDSMYVLLKCVYAPMNQRYDVLEMLVIIIIIIITCLIHVG